jgi:hypothetical protein
MRNLHARLVLLGAFAAIVSACTNGGGGALPFAGAPNAAGGSTGTFQSGASSTALLRFVQGSPDYASVDICVDNIPFGVTAPSLTYGNATANLYAISGGISHTVSVFPSIGAAFAGNECSTAPGPYLGTVAIAVTTIAPGTGGNPARETIVLGGRAAGGTLGLYVYGEPSFAATPPTEAISHNAAPAFTAASANKSVGFGYIPMGGVPTNLTGATGVGAPTIAGTTVAVVNANVVSTLPAVPASFYDGAGVTAGTVVPIKTVAAPGQVAGQPYVIQLYAIDAAAGGLNLVVVPEQTTGFGF